MINITVERENIIHEILDWANESEGIGESKFPGATYEQGVKATIDWILGYTNIAPDEN